MKSLRIYPAALLAALFLTVSAFAADPSGTWKWTTEFNGQSRESTAKLDLKEGQLTGTVSSRMGETPISNATYKDDALAFVVVRERDGNKFEIKYQGKLQGDSVTGTILMPGWGGGEPRTVDWVAKRATP